MIRSVERPGADVETEAFDLYILGRKFLGGYKLLTLLDFLDLVTCSYPENTNYQPKFTWTNHKNNWTWLSYRSIFRQAGGGGPQLTWMMTHDHVRVPH